MPLKPKLTADQWISLLGPVLTVAGLLLGVWQFGREQAHQKQLQFQAELLRDDLEFRRRLWLQRLETFQNLSNDVGNILANLKGGGREASITAFNKAYWGSMLLVEDPEVEREMVAFNLELKDLVEGWSSEDKVKLRAERLLRACRRSLEQRNPSRLPISQELPLPRTNPTQTG